MDRDDGEILRESSSSGIHPCFSSLSHVRGALGGGSPASLVAGVGIFHSDQNMTLTCKCIVSRPSCRVLILRVNKLSADSDVCQCTGVDHLQCIAYKFLAATYWPDYPLSDLVQ